MAAGRSLLDLFGVGIDLLTEVVLANPSLRGYILGYLAERMLRDWFIQDGRIARIRKDDDHDRENKGDLVVTYQGFDFRIEVKSLQTNSIRLYNSHTKKWIKKVIQLPVTHKLPTAKTGKKPRRPYVESEDYRTLWLEAGAEAQYKGTVQCDASDKREILLPDGSKVTTTNLKVGEFDLLAMGLFAFRERWDFGFMLNRDLPRSTAKKYPPAVRQHLIKTSIPVTWPLPEHCVSDPFILLDQLIQEKRQTKS